MPTPDSPATNAIDGRPTAASASAARSSSSSAARPTKRVLVTREDMTPVSRRAPPERGERIPAAAGSEDTCRILACVRAARHRADGAGCAVNDAYASGSNPLRWPDAEAPYGTWRSPIDGDVRGPRPGLGLLDGHGARRRRLLVRGAPAGGRPRRDRRAAARGPRPPTRSPRAAAPAPACTSTAAARSPCTAARSSSATTPTSASTACDPAASRGRSRPSRTLPFGLRYADLRVTRRLARVRARARRRARARQRPRRAAARRLGRAARHRRRPRLLRRAPRLARRHAARLADLGPPADAVGGLGAVGRGARAGRHDRRAPARRRRARRRRSCSPSGARTACCTSARTAPAGGTSTAATTSR